MISEYITDLKNEFRGYNKKSLTSDLLSGITVAAVALPLALAFGVSSGSDAAAGLITAIIAAFIIGALSGASFQISGPTGAMAAILIPLSIRYGLKTVLMAGMLSGVILVILGLFKAGRIVSFLPNAVITGFTSGISVIIILGQVENFLGVKSYGEESYMRVVNIFKEGLQLNYHTMIIGIIVIALMILWPQKLKEYVPASLFAVIAATVAQMVFKFPVEVVGTIPRTLIHDTRFLISDFFTVKLDVIMLPAISIAALCMIESLLCGAVAGKMKGERMRNDRELVAQGIGNIILPFFGGVPATAAIARTSVSIKSGSKTRLSGVFHGVILLMSMFLLSPFMSQIPMSALAGILIVTAWRMNEWHNIRYIVNNKFKSAISMFVLTLLCTVIFDLTIAIAFGCMLSMVMFIVNISNVEVAINEFDPKRMGDDIRISQHVQVIYITGSIFFGSIDKLTEKIKEATGQVLILSMRGVPNVDTSGVQEILDFIKDKKNCGVKIMFCGVQPKVKEYFNRSGVSGIVGDESFFWEAEDALRTLANR